LTGLSRRAFAETVGMKAKDVENIEYGNQRMRDLDFQKVCSVYPDFSRWITYEGPLDPVEVSWKVEDSAQRAAVYLVKSNPQLLATLGLTLEEWQSRHHEVLDSLEEEERLLQEDNPEE
jgi:hypothetical protein